MRLYGGLLVGWWFYVVGFGCLLLCGLWLGWRFVGCCSGNWFVVVGWLFFGGILLLRGEGGRGIVATLF